MSLSKLSLPSIGRVLEADRGFIPKIPSAIRFEQPDTPMSMAAALALPHTNSHILSAPSSYLMKTIDFRDNTLEDDEEEQFSLIVGFPGEQASNETQDGDQAQGLGNWIKHNLSLLVTAVRKLLSVKAAEASLRKAVQH